MNSPFEYQESLNSLQSSCRDRMLRRGLCAGRPPRVCFAAARVGYVVQAQYARVTRCYTWKISLRSD